MKTLDSALNRLSFFLICVVALGAPWCFGAWESWWFWPFASCVFAASACFGISAMSRALKGTPIVNIRLPDIPVDAEDDDLGDAPPAPVPWERRQAICALSCLPFLAYVFWQSQRVPVYMSAERHLLLALLPFLLGLTVAFGLKPDQRRRLFVVIGYNIAAIGIYGIVNHLATANRLVLWAEGYPQYYSENRATGPFFCPDHFSGIMELGVCMGTGMALAQRVSMRQRSMGVLLAALGTVCVILSKSRGGGLTLVVLVVASLIWGLTNYPKASRWWWRLAGLAACGILLAVFVLFAEGYRDRFMKYFGGERMKNLPAAEAVEIAKKSMSSSARGVMYDAAWRAWKTSPVIGIGPGMHGNLWPQIAPSPDGDREAGVWPTRLNNSWQSYEVHSDWLQLLEEHGLIGLFLFLIPFFTIFWTLTQALRQDPASKRRRATSGAYFPREVMAISAILAFVGFAFHSLGDFNLQIPANNWVLAALISIQIGMMGDMRVRARRS